MINSRPRRRIGDQAAIGCRCAKTCAPEAWQSRPDTTGPVRVIGSSELGVVSFLNGTTCSGKSTIAKALQATLDGVWIRMGIDDFNLKLRDAIADGRADLEMAAVHQRLVRGFHRAVAGYASAGNNVIVDHVLGEHWRLDDCLTVFSGLRVTFVGVHCPLPELERREKERSNRRAGSAARQFPLVHAHGLYDVEVNSDEKSPAACARHIAGRLVDEATPTAFDRLRAARSV